MKLRLALLSTLLAVAAFAADATGKWTAEMPGRNGGNPMTITFDLKAAGGTLTGTVGSPQGSTDITNGKVDGDTITFSIVREMQGNSIKINYTGKVSDSEIKFTQEREGGQGRAREFTAKRSTT